MVLKIWKSTDGDAEEKKEWLEEKKKEKNRDKFKKVDRKKREIDFEEASPEENIKDSMQKEWIKNTHPRG